MKPLLTGDRHGLLGVPGLILALVVLAGVLASGCGRPAAVPTPKSLLDLELAYKEETRPLINDAILNGGTPLAEVYLDLFPDLVAGDPDAYERFVQSAERALPIYREALAKWMTIQPPSVGDAGKSHTAYALAWGERVASLTFIIQGWKSGDDEMLEEGFAKMETAGPLGTQAEALRLAFNTHLFEQCQVDKAPGCS